MRTAPAAPVRGAGAVGRNRGLPGRDRHRKPCRGVTARVGDAAGSRVGGAAERIGDTTGNRVGGAAERIGDTTGSRGTGRRRWKAGCPWKACRGRRAVGPPGGTVAAAPLRLAAAVPERATAPAPEGGNGCRGGRETAGPRRGGWPRAGRWEGSPMRSSTRLPAPHAPIPGFSRGVSGACGGPGTAARPVAARGGAGRTTTRPARAASCRRSLARTLPARPAAVPPPVRQMGPMPPEKGQFGR
ncbi:hypothetical protein GCM10010363_67710 [Streptomyces omiyaensis]|nr:hypothetical protein GCM10010363_67710 [Streptomyces omiyaensis]